MNKSIKKYQTLFHSFIIKQESILRWFSGNWMESKCLCSLCSLVKRGSQMGMSCSYSPRSTRRPLLPKCPEREQPRRRERTGGKHTANSLLGIVCLRLSLSLMFQKTAWESQEHVTHFRNALSLSSVNVIHILRSELSLNAFILEKKKLTQTHWLMMLMQAMKVQILLSLTQIFPASDVWFANESFFWTGSFAELVLKSDWIVWNSSWLESAHR